MSVASRLMIVSLDLMQMSQHPDWPFADELSLSDLIVLATGFLIAFFVICARRESLQHPLDFCDSQLMLLLQSRSTALADTFGMSTC